MMDGCVKWGVYEEAYDLVTRQQGRQRICNPLGLLRG